MSAGVRSLSVDCQPGGIQADAGFDRPGTEGQAQEEEQEMSKQEPTMRQLILHSIGAFLYHTNAEWTTAGIIKIVESLVAEGVRRGAAQIKDWSIDDYFTPEEIVAAVMGDEGAK